MSTPVDPAAADAAVQAQLSEQAGVVAGTPSAGIYGDQAGAGQPSGQTVDLSAAKAVVVDAEALLARIQALEAQQAAAEAAANPVPDPPDTSITADSNAPGWLHAAFARIESRLQALEGK